MNCKIPECQRLGFDHEHYAQWDNARLTREADGMRTAEYRRSPRIHLKEGGPMPVDTRRQQITRLALSCLALLTVCTIAAVAFHAIVIPGLIASAAVIATGVCALKVWRRQSVDILKVIADQINAGQFRGVRHKIKPLLQERFYTPGHRLYLNPNDTHFQDWVEERVDRSHHNGGIHFDAYIGMAMLMDAYDSIQDVKGEKQFAALRQDIIIGLKLAAMRRVDINTPGEKAFGYIVLHRPLSEVKAILQKA